MHVELKICYLHTHEKYVIFTHKYAILLLSSDRASTRIQESLHESERHVKGLIGLGSLEEKGIEGIEVPCYTFASILAATDNFSDSNKLGRGGYGPVYKVIHSLHPTLLPIKH